MTVHADEGRLLALLDGELAPPERGHVEAHLAACLPCARALREMRTLDAAFDAAVAPLAAAPDVEAARRAVRGGDASPATGRGVAWRGSLPRAAALLLGAATATAAAAATLPGLPLRAWLGLGADEGDAPAAVAETPAAALPPVHVAVPPAVQATAGVAVAPVDGRVRISVTAPAPALRVRTLVADVERATVTTVGPASSARFRTGPGRVEVVSPGAGEVTVELPSSARTAVVEVDGRVYLSKEGDRLRLLGPVETEGDAGVVFRVGAP